MPSWGVYTAILPHSLGGVKTTIFAVGGCVSAHHWDILIMLCEAQRHSGRPLYRPVGCSTTNSRSAETPAATGAYGLISQIAWSNSATARRYSTKDVEMKVIKAVIFPVPASI